MMNVVAWARVSSREQREGYSIDAQLRAMRDKASRSGWRIVREFVAAESAKRGADRIAFNEMFNWVKANAKREKIDAIFAHKLDRVCRNMRDAVRLQELEDTCRVQLTFVENQFGPGAAGALSFNVMAAVELCGVKVCGGDESGMIRKVLDEIRKTNAHGQFIRRSGSELAKLVGCVRGQNGVAEAIAGFRNHVCQVMLDEANIQLDRLRDIILNDRVNGYRLSSKIIVRDVGEPTSPRSAAFPLDSAAADDSGLNLRQQWALDQLAKHGQLRKPQIMAEFRCSPTTAERDLRDLRRQGLIEFIGPPKTGHWRLAR